MTVTPDPGVPATREAHVLLPRPLPSVPETVHLPAPWRPVVPASRPLQEQRSFPWPHVRGLREGSAPGPGSSLCSTEGRGLPAGELPRPGGGSRGPRGRQRGPGMLPGQAQQGGPCPQGPLGGAPGAVTRSWNRPSPEHPLAWNPPEPHHARPSLRLGC